MLKTAISNRDMKRFGDLLELDGGNSQKFPGSVSGLLATAVCTNDKDVLKFLINHGFDINSVALNTSGKVSDGNENLVSKAVVCDKQDKHSRAMIELILESGYKYYNSFSNPIVLAIRDHLNEPDLVIWLHEKGIIIPPDTAIFLADKNPTTNKNFYKILDYLLGTGGVNINIVQNGHFDVAQTLLGIATTRSDETLVRYLVEKGARSDVQFRYSDTGLTTPLDYAISKGNITLAKILKSSPNH